MENVKPKVVIFNYFLNPKYNFTQNIVDWYESMKKNYLTDCDRQFVVYTDNPNAKNAIKDDNIVFVDVDASKTKNIGENKLNKFKYILDCVNQHQFDYFSFIQSNARCVKLVTLSELVGDSQCDLVVFRHCSFPKISFKGLYYNKAGSTVDISKINTTNFTYVQNCHFLANRKTILDICQFINSSVDKDYSNPLYKTWYNGKTWSIYDERYFNFYLNTKLLPDKCKKIRMLDGGVYIHAPYSNKKDFKIDMIDKTKPYKAMTSQNARLVSIFMASFPYRKKWMIKCIRQLISQCDNFYLWLNEYKEVPQELKQFDQNKLHITLGDMNLKENGRYTFINRKECQDDYCFICDDDINWPKDYVKNTIECFKRHGDSIVVAYFINSHDDFNRRHYKDDVVNPYTNWIVPHYRFGLGTAAFVPSIVKFKFTRDELNANYDMEMILGKQCHDKGIKLYSPKRPDRFVTFIGGSEIDKCALHLCGIAERIKKTLSYIQRDKNVNLSHKPKITQPRISPKKKFKQFQFG